MTEHLKLVAANAPIQLSLAKVSGQVRLFQADNDGIGQTLDQATKSFRNQVFRIIKIKSVLNLMQVVDLAFRANWSLGSLEVAQPFFKAWTGKNPADRRTNADMIPALQTTYLANFSSFLLEECFPDKSVLADGSPMFANIELFSIVVVDKKFNVVEVRRSSLENKWFIFIYFYYL